MVQSKALGALGVGAWPRIHMALNTTTSMTSNLAAHVFHLLVDSRALLPQFLSSLNTTTSVH